MRFALLVVPKAKAKESVADRVSDRLSEPDAGFEVAVREVRPGVAERLSRELSNRALAKAPLFVLISGRALLDGEGEVQLRLGKGERIAFSEIRTLLSSASDQVFLLVDVWHRPDPDDPTLSVSLVGAIRDAIDPATSGIGLLVGAVPSETRPEGSSAFLSLWLDTLDKGRALLKQKGQAVTRAVYDAMKADGARFHRTAAAGFFGGRGDFPLLFEPSIVVDAPPSRRSGRPSGKISVPPPSLPPGTSTPAIDEAWKAGSVAAREGKHQEAIEHYKKALLLLGQKPERAELYHRIGIAKEALGSASEAINNYDKAIGIEPLHRDAVDRILTLLRAQKDFERIEKVHKRRFEAHKNPQDRTRELRAIASMWFDEARDMQHAAPALEKWVNAEESAEGWEKLAHAHSALGRLAAANEARKHWARLLNDPLERAKVLTAAARTAADHLPNGGEAVELARQALEEDPNAFEALEVSANLLGTRRRWQELAELYEWLLERVEDPRVAWDLSKKLGELLEEELSDRAGALRAYVKAAEHNPSDVELRFVLAERFEADGELGKAAEQMCAAANWAPNDSRIYRRALGFFEKLGENDRAWLAAAVLDDLGDADINESLLADTHRPEGLITPQAVFDAEMRALLRPERDEKLERVLASIRETALAVAASRHHIELGAASLQDPTSTTTLSRSSSWASRVFGIEAPKLYVLPDVVGSMAVLPIPEPTVAASRALGSGLGLPELAFLWARTLIALVPEHRLLTAYPTRTDLGKLLLATLAVAEIDGADVEGDIADLADRLDEELEDDAWSGLETAAKDLGRRRMRPRVEAYARSVLAAQSRAALIAAGDVTLAVELAKRFPLAGEISIDEQLADIRAFAISREHAELRRRLGVALAN